VRDRGVQQLDRLEPTAAAAAGHASLKLIDNFSSPVYLTAPPADSQRLFVVEQGGAIRVLHNDTVRTRPFLDLSGRISSGGERGLLSVAFHPSYATNGRFYVYFTNPAGDIRIVRYRVSSDPDSADEATADTVLRVAHPGQSNHNGGQLQFGPDGMLYAGWATAAAAATRAATGKTSTRCSANCCGSTSAARAATRFPRTIRPAAIPASRRRCGPTGCAIRGAFRSIARPATCTSATSDRIRGRKWMFRRPRCSAAAA